MKKAMLWCFYHILGTRRYFGVYVYLIFPRKNCDKSASYNVRIIDLFEYDIHVFATASDMLPKIYQFYYYMK